MNSQDEKLREARGPDEIAERALVLAEQLWRESGPAERLRILKYAKLSCESYLLLGRAFQAIWVLSWLRESTSLLEESLSLEKILIQSLSRRPSIQKKKDDHLPLPTGFQEFSAKVSMDFGRGDEVVRDQLRLVPQVQSPLFTGLKMAEVARLLRVVQSIRLEKNQILFCEHEAPTGFYVLCAGEMKIGSAKTPARKLSGTEFLGEIALFSEIPHSATAQAVSDCRLIYFENEKLQEPFLSIPRLKEELHDLFHRRLFMSVASHSLIFRHFDQIDLEKSWEFFVPIQVSRGQVLLEPRMAPERFFVILKGRVEVLRKGSPPVILGPGHFIGERGVILNHPRNARVTTLSDCLLLECDRWSYLELRSQFPEAASRIDACLKDYDHYSFTSKNLVID
jgi:CRP-like cAMP-binding protein